MTNEHIELATSLSLALYILIGNIFFVTAFVLVVVDISHLIICHMRVRNSDTKAKIENAASRNFMALIKQQSNDQLEVIKKNNKVYKKSYTTLRPCNCHCSACSGKGTASDGLNEAMMDLHSKMMQAEREKESEKEKNQIDPA